MSLRLKLENVFILGTFASYNPYGSPFVHVSKRDNRFDLLYRK